MAEAARIVATECCTTAVAAAAEADDGVETTAVATAQEIEHSQACCGSHCRHADEGQRCKLEGQAGPQERGEGVAGGEECEDGGWCVERRGRGRERESE